MLERQDLDMIRLVMREEISASEERIMGQMDVRFAEQEERLNQRMDVRFAEQEERLNQRMDVRFAEQEERLNQRMDVRFAEQEERLNQRMDARFAEYDQRMDARFKETENLILGELDRVHMRMQDQLDDMKHRLEELTEYYRIKKLDEVNGALLLKMIQEVEKRVEILEGKTA